MVFGFHLVVATEDEGLQVERCVERAVANALGLHRLSAHLVVREEHAVPGKHRVALEFQVFHDVAERIDIVVAATAHLLLSSLQVVHHGSIGSELSVHGQRLHEHTDGMGQFLGLAAVIDGIEQRFLLVVELGQQIGVGHRE